MKIYISVDMEGMPGTFNWSQEEGPDRERIRKYIYNQMEWVIKGIHESSKNSLIKEIVIADSHSRGDSLIYEFTELDDRITLISGAPRPEYMIPCFDESFDIVFLVGYHAGVGAINAAMDHTYSSRRVHRLQINGVDVNESLINSAYAGSLGVPVGLVIGDKALKDELLVEGAMPWVKFVETKESIGRFASKLKPINKVKEETILAVKSLLDSDFKSLPLYKFDSPVNLRMHFHTSSMADAASIMPYAKRIDGRTIEFVDEDYKTILNAIMALITLSQSATV